MLSVDGGPSSLIYERMKQEGLLLLTRVGVDPLLPKGKGDISSGGAGVNDPREKEMFRHRMGVVNVGGCELLEDGRTRAKVDLEGPHPSAL